MAAKIEVRSAVMKNQIFDEKVKRSMASPGEREKGKDEFIYELNPWDALQILQHIPER